MLLGMVTYYRSAPTAPDYIQDNIRIDVCKTSARKTRCHLL